MNICLIVFDHHGEIWDNHENRANGDNDYCQFEVEEEQDEKFAVQEPDTIVYPGAVMIHIQYAFFTNRTVMATLRLNYMALWAIVWPTSFSTFRSNIAA